MVELSDGDPMKLEVGQRYVNGHTATNPEAYFIIIDISFDLVGISWGFERKNDTMSRDYFIKWIGEHWHLCPEYQFFSELATL